MIKSFKIFLKEEYHSILSTNKVKTGVYKNPDRKELSDLIKHSTAGSLRGVLHGPDAYLVDASHASHHHLVDHLGIKDHTANKNIHIEKGKMSTPFTMGPDDNYKGDHPSEHPWVKNTLHGYQFKHDSVINVK